jgi:hypothetical protein
MATKSKNLGKQATEQYRLALPLYEPGKTPLETINVTHEEILQAQPINIDATFQGQVPIEPQKPIQVSTKKQQIIVNNEGVAGVDVWRHNASKVDKLKPIRTVEGLPKVGDAIESDKNQKKKPDLSN